MTDLTVKVHLFNGMSKRADRLTTDEYIVYQGQIGRVIKADFSKDDSSYIEVLIAVERKSTSDSTLVFHETHQQIVKRNEEFHTVRVELVK